MAHYLVIRLSAIGDVAMTIPVVYSAARLNTEDKFTVLTQAFLIPLFRNLPENVDVIGINTRTTEHSLPGLLKFTSALLHYPFDAVLDLHDVLRTVIIRTLFRLKGRKVYVVDKARIERHRLTDRKNTHKRPLRPMIERYADVFRKAGLAYQSIFRSLYQDVPEFCKSVKVLKKDKVNPEDVSIEDKDWSLAPSKYIEFIDHDLDIDYKKEMARIQDEMRLLMASEELSQSMLKDAFRGIGYGIN